MNSRLSSPLSTQDKDPFPSDIPPQTVSRKSRPASWWQQPLRWWYYLTAPPEAPANARLDQREATRRGRLASVVLFFVILLVLPAIPSAVGNPILTTTLALVLVIDGVALALNRAGKTNLAGILVVISIEIGLATSVLTVIGGFGVSNLPMFDLMVQAECVAVSLFVPSSVFFVAIANSVFFVCVLNLTPITPELSHLLQTDGSRIISSPIILQVIVAIVTYLWVSSANKAILRADRAEEIAALEQREIERQQHEIEVKQQLDLGIQQIMNTHVQVANGNFSARAPLSKDNVLWQIAYSLNNLLARLQGYNQMQAQQKRMQAEIYRLQNALQSASSAQQELQRTKEAATRLVNTIQQSKDGSIHPSQRSGTVIDSIVTQLSNPTVSSEPKKTFPLDRTRTASR